ncbi:MAG TPA: hypothetical protein VF796_01780, partial [Humisphaera sp.]
FLMPTYVYRIVRPAGDERPEETFEVQQSIHAEPLTKHPETGEPVERVLTAPQIRTAMGNVALGNAGFTKYVKTSDGTYERQAGTQGPKTIRRDS